MGILGTVIAPGAPPLAVPPFGFVNQEVNLRVTRRGLQEPHVIGSTVTSGLDMPVPQATVTYTEKPDWGVNDPIEIYLGATPGQAPPLRFRGLVKDGQAELDPHEYSLVCLGNLSMAADYQQQYGDHRVWTNGLWISQLMNNSPHTTWTDQAIVKAVLAYVPGLTVDPANIGGTSTELPGLAVAEGFWRVDESALDFIGRIDHSALGYRTFETIGGQVVRVQVAGHPNNAPEFTFTTGVDIWAASGRRIIQGARNAVFVQGYSGGEVGPVALTWDTYKDGAQGGAGGALPYTTYATFSDPFIQRRLSGSAGPGWAAQDVGNWQLGEVYRQRVEVQMTTFRDWIVGPGQTHVVIAPHIDVGQFGPPASGESLWVLRVEVTARSDPALFQQTFSYLGGGLADAPTPTVLWNNQ